MIDYEKDFFYSESELVRYFWTGLVIGFMFGSVLTFGGLYVYGLYG